MDSYYEDFLVYSGKHYSIYFHAEAEGLSRVFDHFDDCDQVTQASLLYLAKRISDIGHIYDETKFRIEDRHNKIYCFKPRDERFFCFFFAGRKIIITSAYRKKSRKLDRNELKRAIYIRNEYYSE